MIADWRQELKDRRYHLSALTKNSKARTHIDSATISRLVRGQLVDPPIDQKIETVLRWFADQSKEFGQGVKVEASLNYPIATCRSDREFRAILDAAIRLGYLDGTTDEVVVSVKGLQHLAERTNAMSSTAFIAMSFADALRPVNEAISDAIRMAGYRPVRVDEEEYVGGVMDKVITLIRDSRFVVADFTGNRGGVYYEAGFASGMGITVIPVCDHSQLESTVRDVRLHFDVHHLNFLDWKVGELARFSEKLKNRILAILGRGPIALPPDGHLENPPS
jgi:nucleoside 2-deoxyribosyltransferase